jgi:hypothetical protein
MPYFKPFRGFFPAFTSAAFFLNAAGIGRFFAAIESSPLQ